jgi:hypothetical protein
VSLLSASIKTNFIVLPIVVVALLTSLLSRQPVGVKLWLTTIVAIGLVSLFLFQLAYQLAARTSIAIGFAGGAVIEIYACLAVSSGLLGNRVFPAPWKYASLIVSVYGILILLQRLRTYWLIHRS